MSRFLRRVAGSNGAGSEAVYAEEFYRLQVDGARESADAVVPLLLDVFGPVHSVIDVGCGAAPWASAFRRLGVPEVLGVDGGAVPPSMLEIPADRYRAADLEEPLRFSRRFDVAVCVEVAEHLSRARGPSFVADLCALADVVVFGAAIPGQGGTAHVNERWASYWAALFVQQGFECFDIVRPRVWDDVRVEWWYQQNTLCYVNAGNGDAVAAARAAVLTASAPIDVVHPRCSLYQSQRCLQLEDDAVRIRRLEAAAREIELDLDFVRRELAAMCSSRSWRLTRPLRAVQARARGIRGPRQGPVDDITYVTALYRTHLGRDPDAAGLRHWVEGLRDGRLSRDDVAAAVDAAATLEGGNG